MMDELSLHYPPEACPFCAIAAAYPTPSSFPQLWNQDLEACVPGGKVEPGRTSPGSFVVLASRDVIAFLDILPMVGGKSMSVGKDYGVLMQRQGICLLPRGGTR